MPGSHASSWAQLTMGQYPLPRWTALGLLGANRDSKRGQSAEFLHSNSHSVRAIVCRTLAMLGVTWRSSTQTFPLGDGSGYQLGPILIHHSCQSATRFSRVSSSCLISSPGLCVSFCNVLFPLNNTVEGSSVTSSEKVTLAAFHPGGVTACPTFQPISIPLLPSGHSPLKHPLEWPGYTLPSLFSLSLSNGSPI